MPADDEDAIVKQYGGTVQAAPHPGDDEDALVAKYGGTVQHAQAPTSQPSATSLDPMATGAIEVAKGAWKGLKHTLSQTPTPYMNYKTPPPRPDLAPSGIGEHVGYGLEQLGEFAAPGGLVSKGGKAIEAATKIPAARVLGKAVLEAMSGGTIAGAQTGGDPEAMRNAALASGGMSAIMGASAPSIAKTAKQVGVSTYMSAMKPSTTLDQAARGKLFQTAQLEGIPVSEGGLATASAKIDDLQKQVTDAINTAPAAPGQGISKFDVAKRLNDPYQRFATQATPQDDLAAISTKGNQFLEAQPNEFTPAEAQNTKIGTYNALRKKGAYGGESAAGDEAQKALARGLKEELQTRIPELQGLNAREGALIQLEGALQKAVARIQNANKFPLRSLIGAGIGVAGGGAHGGNLEAAGAGAGMAILAYVLDDPWVKSRLAIAIGRGADALAKNSGAIAGVAAPVAAYGATPSGQQRPAPPPQQ